MFCNLSLILYACMCVYHGSLSMCLSVIFVDLLFLWWHPYNVSFDALSRGPFGKKWEFDVYTIRILVSLDDVSFLLYLLIRSLIYAFVVWCILCHQCISFRLGTMVDQWTNWRMIGIQTKRRWMVFYPEDDVMDDHLSTWIWILTFAYKVTQASPGACNPFLLFYNAYLHLSLKLCALSK